MITYTCDEAMIVFKNVDDLNRLRFTKDVMEFAGFQSGDEVMVTLKDKEITVTPVTADSPAEGRYAVDIHTNIRVGLEEAGFKSMTYKIRSVEGKITAKSSDF